MRSNRVKQLVYVALTPQHVQKWIRRVGPTSPMQRVCARREAEIFELGHAVCVQCPQVHNVVLASLRTTLADRR